MYIPNARQQIQIDDITSSNPRLVKKIVARGSWFVVRKKPAIILGWAVMKSHSGLPVGAAPTNADTAA